MPTIGKRADFQKKVEDRLGKIESSKLAPTADAWNGIIDDAVDAYGKLRPNSTFEQAAGSDTTRRYVLSGFTPWVKRTSHVLRVESVDNPDTDDELVSVVDSARWLQRRSAAGEDVLFLEAAIGAGQTIRIHYSIPHLIHSTDANLTTVPDGDCEAVVALAIGKAAEWISRTASDLANLRLGADDVDYGEISDRWSKRAMDSLRAGAQRLAGEPAAAPAAASTVEWTAPDAISGIPLVSH